MIYKFKTKLKNNVYFIIALERNMYGTWYQKYYIKYNRHNKKRIIYLDIREITSDIADIEIRRLRNLYRFKKRKTINLDKIYIYEGVVV